MPFSLKRPNSGDNGPSTPSSSSSRVKWSETKSSTRLPSHSHSVPSTPHSSNYKRIKSYNQGWLIEKEAEESDEEDTTSQSGRRLGPRRILCGVLNEEEVSGEQGQDQDVISKEDQILCIHAPASGNLAAAFYETSSKKMFVLEDTKDTRCWDLARLVMEQVHPHKIITSVKTLDSLVDEIEKYCKENIGTTHEPLLSRIFTYAAAVRYLSFVQIKHDPRPNFRQSSGTSVSGEEGEREDVMLVDDNAGYGYGADDRAAGMGKHRLSLVKLGCWVNVDAPLAVAATGALINYIINRQKLDGEDGTKLELTSIESMDLERYMLINQDALTEPTVYYLAEPLGILNTAVTSLGKKLFHTWMLRPLLDINQINARLDAVQLFAFKDNHEDRRRLIRAMKRINNVATNCMRILSGKANFREWKQLLEAMNAACEVNDYLVTIGIGHHIEVISKLQHYMARIPQVIDFDSSKDENRICVAPGIDRDLDDIKNDFAKLEPLLQNIASVIARSLDTSFGHNLNVVYIPQLGYLIAVEDRDPKSPIPQDWDRKFIGANIEYFKTKQMINLDAHYGDIANEIAEIEWQVVKELAEMLADVKDDLIAAVDAIAELDCLIALAEAVDRFHLRRPILQAEPVLKIHRGRHIIQEMCVEQGQYIDNDTLIQGGPGSEKSMMVVTGANGSGKSAYGKQVALITFMAQIGSFVPAESAEIGICDKSELALWTLPDMSVFTRLQTRESASKPASAFMIDLAQVSLALRGATERSLLILDEFGKGTTPSDGAGLLAGVITHLLKTTRPRTVILTHFHEMFTQRFIDESLPILFCHMKTIFVEGPGELTYLYKLSPTLSTTSNAAECALQHGIPQAIVNRAREVSECLSTFQISRLVNQQLTEEDVVYLKNAEQLAKRFLRWNIDEDDERDVMEDLKMILKGDEKEAKEEGGDVGGDDEESQRSAREEYWDGPIRFTKSADVEAL